MFNYNLRAFQRAKDESHMLPLTPAIKSGSQTLIRIFMSKTGILSMKLRFKVPLL